MKKWEILKTCRTVIDENEDLIKNMGMKEKLKESVMWDENEAKEYNEWKVRNVRQMSLKESKVKETVKTGPFEEFCAMVDLESEKGLWERKAEKENEMKENDLKEIQNERKSARS